MNVSKEWKKYLSRGKTEDTLIAYYINFKIETAKINQTETNNFYQRGTEYSSIKATKDRDVDISELQEEASTVPPLLKMTQYRVSFSLCNCFIIDKTKLQI